MPKRCVNVNSRVRVADVYVGGGSIELKNWVATLTLDLAADVKLPENTLAKIARPASSAASTCSWTAPRTRRATVEERRDHPPDKFGVPTTERVRRPSIATICVAVVSRTSK